MDGDHLDPDILRDPRKIGRVETVVIPAHPHLDRDRNVDRRDGRLHQPRRQRNLAHQGRASETVDDLAHRATEIDVDDIRAAIGVEPRRLAHRFRIAAHQLHRDRLLDRIPGGFLDALPRLANRGLAGDHLGDVEARAIAAHQLAERQIGDAGHRRQHDRRVDGHGADLDRLRRDRREGMRAHEGDICLILGQT